MPQAEIARIVGRNRSTVANLLRLLQLPAEIQALVHQGKLSEGHARALLALGTIEAIARARPRRPSAQGWSVREMEARVRGERAGGAAARGAAETPARPAPDAQAGRRRAAEAARHRRTGHRPAARARLPHDQLLLQRRSRPAARADHSARAVRGMKAGARGHDPHPARRGDPVRTVPAAGLAACGVAVGAGGIAVLVGMVLLGVLTFRSFGPRRGCPGLERQGGPTARRTTPRSRQLSAALDSVEQRYAQVRRMIGADIVRDPLAVGLPPAARAGGHGPELPGAARRPSRHRARRPAAALAAG